MIIICKECKKESKLYGNGLCNKCYMKEYSRDYYRRKNKKTILVEDDVCILLKKKRIRKVNGKLESLNDTIKRLIQ